MTEPGGSDRRKSPEAVRTSTELMRSLLSALDKILQRPLSLGSSKDTHPTKFSIGDRCFLKSGSPMLTVVDVDEIGNMLIVSWHDQRTGVVKEGLAMAKFLAKFNEKKG